MGTHHMALLAATAALMLAEMESLPAPHSRGRARGGKSRGDANPQAARVSQARRRRREIEAASRKRNRR